MIGSIRSAPRTSSSLDVPGSVHVKFLGLVHQRHDLRNNGCVNLGNKRCLRNLQSSSLCGARLELAVVRREDLLSRPGIRKEACARAQRAGGKDDVESLLPSGQVIKSASASSFEQLLRHARSNRCTNFKSSIVVLGLSVHNAPVSLREKLAVPEAEWPRAISELCEQNHIEEAAILSTCNRLEVYVVALSWNLGVQEVIQWMSETSGIRVQDLREHLFILRDRDATQHLFRVSSGLDSLVLGEGQILSQVKQVHKVGQTAAPKFGRNLNGLFKQAITAGKRVRSETSISSGAVSISSAAVELAVMKLSQQQQALCNADVLIVGAGKMSKLLVKHLIAKGCSKIVVVNRTEQRVLDLQADSPDVEIVYQPLSKLMKCAGEADIIFTSTASEAPLFSKQQVEKLPALSGASSSFRHFIDISVPRNVSPRVAEVESTVVYNVDDLREVVEANKDERRRKALEAQVIIEEELQSFEAWRDSLETVPTIKKLRAYAEKVRVSELEKCLGKMGEEVTKKDRRLLEDLTRGIVNKLLHGPMQHLRCDGADTRTVGETLENMHALERMFDLKTDLAAIEKRLEAAAAEKIKQ